VAAEVEDDLHPAGLRLAGGLDGADEGEVVDREAVARADLQEDGGRLGHGGSPWGAGRGVLPAFLQQPGARFNEPRRGKTSARRRSGPAAGGNNPRPPYRLADRRGTTDESDLLPGKNRACRGSIRPRFRLEEKAPFYPIRRARRRCPRRTVLPGSWN